jgi:hypothetical protein
MVKQSMKHYSAIKRDELLVNIVTWMDFKGILIEAGCSGSVTQEAEIGRLWFEASPGKELV